MIPDRRATIPGITASVPAKKTKDVHVEDLTKRLRQPFIDGCELLDPSIVDEDVDTAVECRDFG